MFVRSDTMITRLVSDALFRSSFVQTFQDVQTHWYFALISCFTRYCSQSTLDSSLGTPSSYFLHRRVPLTINMIWSFPIPTASVLSLLWSLCVIVPVVFSSSSNSLGPFLVPDRIAVSQIIVARKTFIYIAFFFCIGRCKYHLPAPRYIILKLIMCDIVYTNSLLASLNVRKQIRSMGVTKHTTSEDVALSTRDFPKTGPIGTRVCSKTPLFAHRFGSNLLLLSNWAISR